MTGKSLIKEKFENVYRLQSFSFIVGRDPFQIQTPWNEPMQSRSASSTELSKLASVTPDIASVENASCSAAADEVRANVKIRLEYLWYSRASAREVWRKVAVLYEQKVTTGLDRTRMVRSHIWNIRYSTHARLNQRRSGLRKNWRWNWA